MKKILMVVIGLCFAVSSYAFYYGIPVVIEGSSTPGVQVCSGDTPFPTNSIFPVSPELRQQEAKYLKVVGGQIVVRTTAEKAFVDLAIQYKKQVGGIWVEMTEAEKRLVDLPAKYKHEDGTEMTAEEKRVVDLPAKYKHEDGTEMTEAEKAAVDAAAEAARQAAKPLVLKMSENSFLGLCDQLTGTNTHVKIGFNMIKMIIAELPLEYQVSASIQLLATDAELKREGGNLWWDDCVWHPEIME